VSSVLLYLNCAALFKCALDRFPSIKTRGIY
jgi:hypothetical protein